MARLPTKDVGELPERMQPMLGRLAELYGFVPSRRGRERPQRGDR
jgi:hypothetical protein